MADNSIDSSYDIPDPSTDPVIAVPTDRNQIVDTLNNVFDIGSGLVSSAFGLSNSGSSQYSSSSVDTPSGGVNYSPPNYSISPSNQSINNTSLNMTPQDKTETPDNKPPKESASGIKDFLDKNGALVFLMSGLGQMAGGMATGNAQKYAADRSASMQQQQIDLNRSQQEFTQRNGGLMPVLSLNAPKPKVPVAPTGLIGGLA